MKRRGRQAVARLVTERVRNRSPFQQNANFVRSHCCERGRCSAGEVGGVLAGSAQSKPSKKDQMFAAVVEVMVWSKLPTHQMTGLASGHPP
jgi:hypothetical protein